MNIKWYTVDDEEPICTKCDLLNNTDDICERYCGAKHAWHLYCRSEIMGDEDGIQNC